MPFATKSYDYGIPFTQMFDNTGGTSGQEVLYIGRADPGTASTSDKWSICKLSYDANDNVTSVKWASGVTNFDKVWDSRTTYTYT